MDKSSAAAAYAEHRSIRLTGQPFAFAADLVFTAVETTAGNWGIEVHRIWGNQVRMQSSTIRLMFSASSSAIGPHCFRSWM
jgi:hypothetical protein